MLRIRFALTGLLCAVCVLLAACAAAPDLTPVYTTALEQTGAVVTVSDCTAETDECTYTPEKHNEEWLKMPVLIATGTPVVTVEAPADAEVELYFLQEVDKLYLPYNHIFPTERVDYVYTEEDGARRYRLDTATDFAFVITTAQGSDTFLIFCRRDGIS